jgi:WD40 repeat protein
VITGCEDSLVRTWSIETGKKIFEFQGTHGKDEMSCMSLEVSGRRLFTGSRSGMVYVRNHLLWLTFWFSKLTIVCSDLTTDLDLR